MTDNPWLWIGFNAFVLLMLALDLGVFHRKAHVVSFREAIAWTIAWVTLALLFNLGIAHYAGPEKAVTTASGDDKTRAVAKRGRRQQTRPRRTQLPTRRARAKHVGAPPPADKQRWLRD